MRRATYLWNAALGLCALAASAFAANPLVTVLEDFESGTTRNATPVDQYNSSAGGASNTAVANVLESGSRRLQLTDADGTYNGVYILFSGAIPQAGYYLITADVKVDNASAPIGTFGMAVAVGGPSTAKISDVNAGYVMNLTGTGDAVLGYQTIGAALNVPNSGTFPKDLIIYFSTDPSGNSYNAPAADGNFNGTHRGAANTWPAGSSNAVYIDNIKRIGPGNFREERHLWISIGDGFTNLSTLENLLVAAKNNNFNCVDILARYRANAYYVPNRYNTTYPNPEPFAPGASASNDPIQYAIDRGRELGLKIFASFSCFAVTDGSDTYPSYLPSGSVMWYYNGGSPRAMTKADVGGEGLWADVSRADVRNYTKNVILDFVANYDVDGIILDRVRYPNYYFSYNPQGLTEMGISGTPSPTDATFRTARRNAVATFIQDVYDSATALKPWLIIGAAPIAYSDSLVDTYNSVMQFWPAWTSRKTSQRAVSFGVLDLFQPQFYRLPSTTPAGPAANTTLMNKAQFGDVAAYSLDNGLMPGALSVVSPIFYHPSSGDVSVSNCNAQNITDARALAMGGVGIFPATPTLADISYIRDPNASSAGVDVLGSAAPHTDYLFKKDYDNVKPNAVSNFTASPQSDGRVILSWTPPSPAADGETADQYLIYRSTTTPVKEYRSNLVTFAKIPGSATSYTVPTGWAGTYYYRIVPVDDYNNRGPAREVGPITVTGEPTPPADIIVDNPSATFAGTWYTGTSATDKYGSDYRYAYAGTGSATATFAATIPVTGTWTVSEWHCAGTNRATNARHTINYAGGSTVVTVNQTVNGGKWNALGQYNFNAGTQYSVVIDDIFSGSVVIADAIKWSYVIQPPAAPSGLTATAVSQSQINLTWTDNSSNERNFIVARATTSGGPYTDIATLGVNVTSYSDTGLSPNTTYYYVVRASNSAGASANSSQASATTLPNPPAAPSGLSATAVSSSQINLTWTDNSTNESNFVVARSTTSGGPYTDIATLPANTTSYSNTGLSANTTYYYVVRATNAGGSSANSNQASATTPVPDIIVDNPSATFSGTWTTASSATDKYGADYRYATSGSGATATYNANVPIAGNYRVSVWYSQGTNRANNAPYTVNFSGGSLTYSVNQQTNGGTWVTLGTHYFAAGGGQVVIGTAGANPSVVIADAVRFTYLNSNAPVTVTYDAVATEDGYVLESSETSNVGGTINSSNTTFAVGDNSQRLQFKGILSFDTSPIPDDATIQKVTLKLTQYSINGGDPWASLGTLSVDLAVPSFGAATTLATEDFAAAATVTNVATVSKPSGNNVTVSSALSSAGVLRVSKTGKTQLRLQFALDDDNDSANDYVNFYSGNYSTNTAYRPKLEIEYTR
ncbi:N-acetylmuramoyl-L-alanine amidase [Candidatus Sumerlaea chitinivorans]|uniref:N-acetylmuramoyl-L-alanine amidase n=1 Tax=Sumerlaea chitinivorans TaxID=2250252 RepID=A0A2Z4Y7G5_SUMC1|nr:N-acetylmuramoyl-L-alanine amidase [Candidatus Sumerlaea chitinivorans]